MRRQLRFSKTSIPLPGETTLGGSPLLWYVTKRDFKCPHFCASLPFLSPKRLTSTFHVVNLLPYCFWLYHTRTVYAFPTNRSILSMWRSLAGSFQHCHCKQHSHWGPLFSILKALAGHTLWEVFFFGCESIIQNCNCSISMIHVRWKPIQHFKFSIPQYTSPIPSFSSTVRKFCITGCQTLPNRFTQQTPPFTNPTCDF